MVLLRSDAIAGAQLGLGLLQGGATVLPLALLVAFGAGLWLAPDRRRPAGLGRRTVAFRSRGGRSSGAVPGYGGIDPGD